MRTPSDRSPRMRARAFLGRWTHGSRARHRSAVAVLVLLRLGGELRSPLAPAAWIGVVWAPSRADRLHRALLGASTSISPSGGRPRLLTSGERRRRAVDHARRPARCTGSGSSLFTVPLAGRKPRSLGFGFNGVWSPDGKRLAFASNGGFMVEDADGRHRRLVARNRYWRVDRRPDVVAGRAQARVRRLPRRVPELRLRAPDGLRRLRDRTRRFGQAPRHGEDRLPQCPAWSSVAKLAF